MAILIRPATPDDAAGIAAVHVGSWKETYRGLFPADALAALSVEDRTEFWRRTLPGSVTFVACEQDAVVGFLNAGPSRDLEGAEEIYCLYVLRSYWGRGVGRDLVRTGLDRAKASSVTLWVLEKNERARRFYEKAGFSPDGASKPAGIFGSELPKMRYRKEQHA